MEYIKIIKNNKLYIGGLYLFEGEVMKIIVKEPEVFSAGDVLTCEYEEKKFQTKVLKKKDYHIYTLVPQFNEQFPNNKRRHPRLKVDLSGQLINNNSDQYDIQIIDISRSGFGFLANKEPLFKENEYVLQINSEKLKVQSKVILKNVIEQDQHLRCGSEIKGISEDDVYELRRFILAMQLETNMSQNSK